MLLAILSMPSSVIQACGMLPRGDPDHGVAYVKDKHLWRPKGYQGACSLSKLIDLA